MTSDVSKLLKDITLISLTCQENSQASALLVLTTQRLVKQLALTALLDSTL